MKKTVKSFFYMTCLTLLLVSCNKADEYLIELNAFQEELSTNSENYSLSDWENAEAMLAAFKADVVELKSLLSCRRISN